MSDGNRKSITREISKNDIKAANLVFQLLEDHTETSQDACTVLVLAHAKLWHLYGQDSKDNLVEMLSEYVADFFSLIMIMQQPSPSAKNEMIH